MSNINFMFHRIINTVDHVVSSDSKVRIEAEAQLVYTALTHDFAGQEMHDIIEAFMQAIPQLHNGYSFQAAQVAATALPKLMERLS